MTRIYKQEMARQKENCPTLSSDSCLLDDRNTHQLKPKMKKQQPHNLVSGDQTCAVQELLRSLTQPGGAFLCPHRHPAREMLINNPKSEPVQSGYRQGYDMNGALSARDCHVRDKGSRSKGDAGGV